MGTGGLEAWVEDNTSPAGPKGQDTVAASTHPDAPPAPGAAFLSDWLNDNPYTAQAQQWMTGANPEGLKNGWSDAFTEQSQAQWDAALADGTAPHFFDRSGATGVVKWDHTSEDGSKVYRFGDVYEGGRFQHNIYDVYEDKTAADLMMLPWLTDGTTMQRLFTDSDPQVTAKKVDTFVQEQRQFNNANMETALSRNAFQGDVAETQAGYQEGGTDELLAGGGGALGGAVTGAGVGFLVGGPVGAAIGGVVGGAAGLVGGLMNKDEIAEAAARAREISKLSVEENNAVAGGATALQQYAGLTQKFTSPLTNLAHGATDAIEGDVGDGIVERYRVDEKGESTAPMWSKVADWTALAGDSLMQFASPMNRMIYTAQVSSSIAGEATTMAASGGKSFDPREGGFDNVFVSDEGKFDPVSGAAGILKIGIDAVQLVGMRGLANAGRNNAEALAAKGGAYEFEAAGHRFLLDDAGKLVDGGTKRTMALLAPSEQMAYWSAARSARVQAMKEGRAVTADDFYRAAANLASGSNKLKTAVVNALGEGYEEGAQAILEPISHDGRLAAGDIAGSFLYGAAAGGGMSLGATYGAPAQDRVLMHRAYVSETMRADGVEPDYEKFVQDWASLTSTEKQIRAARSVADIETTRSAVKEIGRQHAATFVATEIDAAKAADSRRTAIEKDLASGTSSRPDAYHVMGGLLDVGTVSPTTGERTGNTARAESVEASARTIAELLANRLEGFSIQEGWLANEMAKLSPESERFQSYDRMLANVSLGRVWGEDFVADVRSVVEAIYDENTDEVTAAQLVRNLNGMLEKVFDRQAPLVMPADTPGNLTELADAAAHFVSLLQSREPKLDAGSYLALLPRISWDLTRTGSDNFIQVNVDILQAINGDFDGDKLRSENTLVLDRERYTQARAGQFFTGVGEEIDIAARSFDEGMAGAMAKGLNGEGAIHDEATATMAAIEAAITHRYGSMMSPDALDRIFTGFREAMSAGLEGSRTTLINGLAREASEAITERGRANLSNEWLWISQVVRANLNAYQTQYRKLRALESAGPSETEEVVDFDTPEGTQLRKQRASTDAQTLSLFAVGNSLFRKFQKIHYTFYNSRALATAGAQPADLLEMARTYEELGQGITRAELARVQADDTIAGRVQVMLHRLVDSAMDTEDIGQFDPAAALTILANVKVKDVWFDESGPVTDGQDLSLVQVLLKRALDADQAEHKKTFHLDEKLQARHNRLRALTISNKASGEVNAERAFLEVFKAIPFGHSLARSTGVLAMHTTPEQWLRNYVSLDAVDRTAMERLHTNVPEYLSREKKTNLPYSLDEAKRKEVTPYRSMMDAMIAVGRHELTFDPTKSADKAFGGRIAKTDKRAKEDFRAMHAQLRLALGEYRNLTKVKTKDRTAGARLVQEMLARNPQQGRAILDMIPNAQANALYDFADGELMVTPWLYEVLAEENTERALLQFWWNLSLSRWNATQNRDFNALQSRFDRLMHELAREPGQIHMELMIRKADEAKNLDEFFLWLNTTPGFRGQQAPLLPFVDDVADFEADAAGGWVTIKAGADLREAMAKGRRAAKELRRSMVFRSAAEATDREIHDGILEALNDSPAATDLARDNLRKLQHAVKVSRELPRGFAPSAMLALTRGVVRSFDSGSHEKGKTASTYEGVGEFQALMDAFAFVPGLERAIEVMTAHSLRGLRGNIGDLSRTTGSAMEASGRQVEWEQMTVEQAVQLLGDPRTKPLALALLSPTALDVTSFGMSESLLTEASLKDLLDNKHYQDLFEVDAHNQIDTDMRYLSVIDARARAEGGHFDAIRAANAHAVALTSGLGKPATPDTEDRLTVQAYQQVARIMRMVGKVLATPEMRNSGMLDALREAAVEELKAQQIAKGVPGLVDKATGKLVEAWADDLQTNLELEYEEQKQQLIAQYSGKELSKRSNALKAEYAENSRRLKGLLEENRLAAQVAQYELTGDATVDAAKHARIVEFTMAQASFPNRVDSDAANAWTKLAGQRYAGTRPDLTSGEWDALSRAAIGIALVDDFLAVSNHISVPSIPKAPDERDGGGDPTLSDARFHKYYDPSFAWLVTDLLTEGTPLAKAAEWLHNTAEQNRVPESIDSLKRVLQNTVLDRDAIGTWTPGVMAQLVAAEERVDSAGGPPGIAAAGDGQKRWAAVANATRRTGAVPGADLLTTATFTADYLAPTSNPFNEIAVVPAGGTEAVAMPVAQLDNRFFSSIRVDGNEVPLTDANLGFAWQGADEQSGYRYVALARLLPIVERYAAANGKSLADITIEADFFHPDSQPDGAWNNAFFEGMSHSLAPEGSDSLLSALWADNGGKISKATQWTIDSGKLGKLALMPFRREQLTGALAEAEARWLVDHDFAGMLRRKTEAIVQYDDGSGAVGIENFNAIYKTMKLQHIVVGRDENGAPAAMAAEQVIAFQRANGLAAELPIDVSHSDARGLVKLSPDVVRTMLGETGSQGVARFFDDEFLLNPDMVAPYEGIDSGMLRKFAWDDHQGVPHGWLAPPATLGESSIANVGPQRVMRVKTMLDKKARDSRSERRIFLEKQSAKARAKRYIRLKGDHARDSYKSILELAMGSVETEKTTFDFSPMIGNVLAPRDLIQSSHTIRLLESFAKVRDAQGLERGWLVRDGGQHDFANGILTLESLNDKRSEEHWVVKDDLALVELATFQTPERATTPDAVEERVEEALRYLANSGAYIVLGSGNGAGDLRHHAARYLESLGYESIRGSRHLYGPGEFTYQTQNERAYQSTLMETRLIKPARNAVTFLVEDPIEIDENTAILNEDSTKLRTRVQLNNIVPSSAYPNYNLPIEDNRDSGLYARSLMHLRTMLDPTNTEAREALVKMAGEDPAGLMPIEDALDRAHSRISERASLELHAGDVVEKGDTLFFLHPDGKVLLYRHGLKLPKAEELDALHAVGGMNLALAKSEAEGAATSHSGTIRAIRDRVNYGRELVLEIPLQPYGDKIQLEWNGMKYLVAPQPSWLKRIPRVFRNQLAVDLVSNVQSADSKEAIAGRVRGYREALAFFQWDFTDDMVEFFYPGSKPGDPDIDSKRVLTLDLLYRLADQSEVRIPFADANALAKANVAVADLLGSFAAAEAEAGVPVEWMDRLQAGDDATTQIARAMITYLLTPNANLQNVLKSAGFSHPRANTDTVETREVPGLFADLLDNGTDSAVHTELIRRFDGQLLREPDGSGWKLHPNWMVEMTDSEGGSLMGYLQYGEAHSSGDSPVLDGMAFEPSETGGVSLHNAMAASLSIGALTAHDSLEKSKAFARSFARGGDLAKFGTDGDSVWQMLTTLPDSKDTRMAGWRREQPAETARRAVARNELTGFYQPLNTDGWSETENEAVRYHQGAMRILDRLNLHSSQRVMVDTWVRKALGRPYARDEHGKERGVISFDDAMQILESIRLNLKKGLLPHAGFNVPLIDVNHLTTMYMANANLPENQRWAPGVEGESKATTWDEWVESAFGTAWIMPEGETGKGPEPLFHQMYLLAVDGLMHGYQNATTSTRYLPVSTDALRNRLLMDPDTNRMFVSISADENLLATDPTLFNASMADLENIISGDRIYGPGRNGPDPASALGRQQARLAAWHREVDAPRQVNRKMRGVRAQGQTYLGYTTSTSALFRSMMNLRVGNTLFSVPLMVAAPMEAWYRRTINTFANAITGEATGTIGQAMTRLSESFGDGKIGTVAKQLGLQTTWTSEQHTRINEVVHALSTLPDFKSMVYKEITYQYHLEDSIGRGEKWLKKYAEFGAHMQDPARGMPPTDLARVYVEAAMKKVSRTPLGENIYSVDRMLTELARNPHWLKDQDPEAHTMGIAAIANIRSLKATPLSLAVRGVVEPLSAHPKISVNTIGNFAKLLTAFQNFWAGFATNITGLQGASDFMAFWLDGREKKITARVQAALKGVPYNPKETEHFDMTEALESLDLADAFIRGGVTHTALFALGMMAQGLGLSGEDDEMKFRRRQAEEQGVPMFYDPRTVMADFRNKDSIYLNWLPLGMDAWFRVDPSDPESQSLAQMNWIARTFLSPIIGMERFFNTGDFSEVIQGFQDALGSHPIVNQQLWNAAVETSAELHAAANDQVEAGDMVGGGHMLMTAVGVLSSMLMENSMVNMVYVGLDEWDRDPYVLTQRDSDGELQKDIGNNVRPNETALQPYMTEEGGVAYGYLGRSERGSDLRVLTENRFSLAVLSSLPSFFSGGISNNDYWRYNMPIKTRELDKPDVSQEEIEAQIKAALAFQLSTMKQPDLTAEEIFPVLKGEMIELGKATGQFFDDEEIWAIARERADASGPLALSILDSAGREHLTDKGARAIFDGLRMGTFELGSPETAGLYASIETREKIAAEWSSELIQEGINLGLDETKARARMKRIMGGPLDDPEVPGLSQLLFSQDLSYDDSQLYGQLNTTYVMGPDGRPWATGFRRDGFLGALGLKPFKAMIQPEGGATRLDKRGNTVDLVNGMNTGLRALVPLHESRYTPTDVEIGKSIERAIEKAASEQYTPFAPFEKKPSAGYGSGWQDWGSGWKNYGGWSNWGSGGYGGGNGGYGSAYFSKMYVLPGSIAPYGNNVSFINSSNPILRRAFIRRERISSERGRLNQWQ